MRDMCHNIVSAIALKLQTISTNTTTVGETIDRQGFESLTFSVITGTVTDGDYEFKLFEGDESDMSDEAEVDSGDIINTIPDFTADTDDDAVHQFGYVGSKRYTRVKVVSTSTSSGAVLGTAVIKGHAMHLPVSIPTEAG